MENLETACYSSQVQENPRDIISARKCTLVPRGEHKAEGSVWYPAVTEKAWRPILLGNPLFLLKFTSEGYLQFYSKKHLCALGDKNLKVGKTSRRMFVLFGIRACLHHRLWRSCLANTLNSRKKCVSSSFELLLSPHWAVAADGNRGQSLEYYCYLCWHILELIYLHINKRISVSYSDFDATRTSSSSTLD